MVTLSNELGRFGNEIDGRCYGTSELNISFTFLFHFWSILFDMINNWSVLDWVLDTFSFHFSKMKMVLVGFVTAFFTLLCYFVLSYYYFDEISWGALWRGTTLVNLLLRICLWNLKIVIFYVGIEIIYSYITKRYKWPQIDKLQNFIFYIDTKLR